MSSALEGRRRARQIILSSGVQEPPVPIERLVQQHGITVQFLPLSDELSGMAFLQEGRRFIVVNAGHHPNRQRFTLAHEFAHHILHASYLDQGVHVDKAILNRDDIAGKGTDLKEIAANAFAAELLMPEQLIGPYTRRGLDLNDEMIIESLARRFKVSTSALSYRLMTAPRSARSESKQPNLL